MIQATEQGYGDILITPGMKLGEALNQLLRGELSAVEAYEEALKTIDDPAEVKRLKEFLVSHRTNAEYWREQVESVTVEPDTSSGPWGYVVQAFMSTAKLFGENSTLRALKTGEEHGVKEYKSFLKHPLVEEKDKRFIRNEVLPELERHLNSIDAMMKLH